LWWDKELNDKIKIIYCKEVIDPNIEDKKYFSILASIKKKIKIAKLKQTLTSSIVKLGIGKFLELCELKEVVIFVTLRGLKIKISLY
jgi:hypothetical protein